MSLSEDLADWQDWDVAASSYGTAIGVFTGATQRQIRRVVLTDNPLGEALHTAMLALVDAGVLERRDESDEQFRWVFSGPEALPGSAGAQEADALPTALNLPETSNAGAAPQTPAGPLSRWSRLRSGR